MYICVFLFLRICVFLCYIFLSRLIWEGSLSCIFVVSSLGLLIVNTRYQASWALCPNFIKDISMILSYLFWKYQKSGGWKTKYTQNAFKIKPIIFSQSVLIKLMWPSFYSRSKSCWFAKNMSMLQMWSNFRFLMIELQTRAKYTQSVAFKMEPIECIHSLLTNNSDKTHVTFI